MIYESLRSSTRVLRKHVSSSCVWSRWIASQAIQEVPKKKSEAPVAKPKPTKPPFAKNLFVGKFDVDFLAYPEVLDAERLAALKNLVLPIEHYFLEEVDNTLADKSQSISKKNITSLKNLGLFGQQVSSLHGGLNLNSTECARVREITSLDSSITNMLSAHQDAVIKGILLAGNEQQKQHYLRPLATGEWLAAFCLSESNYDVDTASIETNATLSEDGKRWILNGCKHWVTNGVSANLFIVIAKTKVEDHLNRPQHTLTAFLVERSFEGVHSENAIQKLGAIGSEICEVHFKNTPVPVENVLGEVGLGFKLAMEVFESSRLYTGSNAAGKLKKLIGLMYENVIKRKFFGKHLKDFELVQEKIAKIACVIYAVESMTYLTAGIIDNYENPDTSLEAAIVKIFSNENLQYSIDQCQQILGNVGYLLDSPFECMIHDFRTKMAFEEGNDILRTYVALSGLQYAGLILKDEVEKLRNPLMNPGLILKKLLTNRNHVKDTPKLHLGLDGYVHPSLQISAKQLEYCVLRLQYVVEILFVRHGQKIIDQDMELKRLADIVVMIYAMTSVVARASRSYCIGLADADYEVLVASTFCTDAFREVKKNVKGIEDGPVTNNDANFKRIANKIFKSKGYGFQHPLARNF